MQTRGGIGLALCFALGVTVGLPSPAFAGDAVAVDILTDNGDENEIENESANADAIFLDGDWRQAAVAARRHLGGLAPQIGSGHSALPQIGQGKQKTSAGPEVGTFDVDENGVTPAGRVLGVGLQLGLPSGLTVKYMFAPNLGVVGGLGVGAGWYIGPALSVHVDVIYHPHVLVRAEYLTVSWYVGGGGWLGIAENNARPFFYFAEYARYFGPRIWIAARAALGVNLALNDLPIEFYVEGNPALVVFPGLSFGMGFSVGLRFYF